MTKNFRVNVILRLLLITSLIVLLVYFIMVDERYLRSVYLALFLIISLVEFVWYVDRTNRDFTSFLLALLQDDFTTKFSEKGKGKSFENLYKAFNAITQKFENISSAKEVQHLYLEGLVNHIRVGIISIDKDERIHMMNRALQKMLDRPHMAFLNNLNSVDHQLPEVLREIKPNENRLLKIQVKNELLQLSIHASEFLLNKEYYKLISIQNIKSELDINELDAWQKLIRVLTHEIMNSVTPITSLSDSLRQILENDKSDDSLAKVGQGLEAIQLRSKGLQNFTEAYKKLTKLPTPKFNSVNLKSLFDNIVTLFKEELKNIKLILEIPEKTEILADRDLLDQVFINLIKNACDALHGIEGSTIRIHVEQNDVTTITITDNGEGIDEDKLDKIFIPFFTTKTEGSGIGLALSRQIIRLHNGSIGIKSQRGAGTEVTITI